MAIFDQCSSPVELKCIVYTGVDIPCLGITTGMRMDEVLDILTATICVG